MFKRMSYSFLFLCVHLNAMDNEHSSSDEMVPLDNEYIDYCRNIRGYEEKLISQLDALDATNVELEFAKEYPPEERPTFLADNRQLIELSCDDNNLPAIKKLLEESNHIDLYFRNGDMTAIEIAKNREQWDL
jgi:hypothetical protein